MSFVKSSFSAQGRVSRKYYWLFVVAFLVAMGAVMIAAFAAYDSFPPRSNVRQLAALGCMLVLGTPLLLAAASVMVRRLRDRGRAGSWLLVLLSLVLLQLAVLNITQFKWAWRFGSGAEIAKVNLAPIAGYLISVPTAGLPAAAMPFFEFPVDRASDRIPRDNATSALVTAPLLIFGLWLFFELGFRGSAALQVAQRGAPWHYASAATLSLLAVGLLFRPWDRPSPYCFDLPGPQPVASLPGISETEDCFDMAGRRVCAPRMVIVPAGSFDMGSPANPGEQPVHRVTIGKPFAVSKFEITQRDWEACLFDGGCSEMKQWYKERWLSAATAGERCHKPMWASWREITAIYLPWLSRKTGKEYRLLSEAEWEYVARAGTTTDYWTGPAIAPEQANFGKTREGVVDVGSYPPNAFGLYDTAGNAPEWVQDNVHVDKEGALTGYAGAPADGSAWYDWREQMAKNVYTNKMQSLENISIWDIEGLFLIVRGGGYESDANGLRSAQRGSAMSYHTAGFRLARDASP